MNEGNMLMEDIIIMLGIAFNLNLPLLTAWLLDHWLGDPVWLPHPVVAFGKAISFCEHRLNNGNARFLKGAAMSLVLVAFISLHCFCCVGWRIIRPDCFWLCRCCLFSIVLPALRWCVRFVRCLGP